MPYEIKVTFLDDTKERSIILQTDDDAAVDFIRYTIKKKDISPPDSYHELCFELYEMLAQNLDIDILPITWDDRLKSTRRGAKGLCQQEMYDVLLPIFGKYWKKYNRDEFWGFADGTISIIRKHMDQGAQSSANNRP